MFKLLLLCGICAITLTACEKKASAEVGAIPKQIIDKAINDINNAEVLTAEKMKVAKNVDALQDVGK